MRYLGLARQLEHAMDGGEGGEREAREVAAAAAAAAELRETGLRAHHSAHMV